MDKNVSQIETPLAIAYVVNQKIEIYPYLDLDKISNVLGVVVDTVVISKQQLKDSIYQFSWLVEENPVKHKVPHLPSFEVMETLVYAEEAFNETIDILRKNGVQADFFDVDGAYWLNVRYSSSEGYIYSVADKDCFLDSKNNDDAYYIRLVWHLS